MVISSRRWPTSEPRSFREVLFCQKKPQPIDKVQESTQEIIIEAKENTQGSINEAQESTQNIMEGEISSKCDSQSGNGGAVLEAAKEYSVQHQMFEDKLDVFNNQSENTSDYD